MRPFGWMAPREFWQILKATSAAWWNDNTFRLAASLAFYTVFSLAPILLIAIGVAETVFGRQAVVDQLVRQADQLIGTQGGIAVRQVIQSTGISREGPWALAVGMATMIVGSTAVFAELQSALNDIWGVKVKLRHGVLARFLRDRLLSFSMVLGMGFILLVSLAISALISGAQDLLTEWMPAMPWMWRFLNLLVSFLYITVLFMMIYKFLPDVQIAWTDVTVGGIVTAVLFTAGKFLIGEYLGRTAIGSAYGAAGSFAVLLIWIYYSALISFYGAEFTQVFARRYGSRIRPDAFAERK